LAYNLEEAKMNNRNGVKEPMEPGNTKSETARGVRSWVRREIMGVVMVAVILFLSAGRLDWVMGWAMVGIYALWVGANALLLIPRNPELLAERAKRQKEGMKTWDKMLLSVVGLATLVKYILAGLDVRYGWTAQIPLTIQVVALVVSALGYALGTWAMVTNAYFSMIVRIQEDRGHAVVSDGPYRYVRHPGYTGTTAFELATPIMLGSLWALIPGVLVAVLTIVRTALEDRTLQEELDGYQDYAQQVRYRLLPGIW
jgi:protein-S-isoprenylcysteine O-methyltransferase Ste14